MMQRVEKPWVDAYLKNDAILTLMDEVSQPEDEKLVCHRWLRETPQKRAIFQEIYEDLLEPGGKKVADIGGGITGVIRHLSEKNDYTLVDLMAHDEKPLVDAYVASAPKLNVAPMDWYEFTPEGPYDVVIANDLFPNADQRLGLFIERFLPVCKELRLLVTYYNIPRFYLTRRVNAEEYLTMLAWDGEVLGNCLAKFAGQIEGFSLPMLKENPPSLYANGRQVCMVKIKGQA